MRRRRWWCYRFAPDNHRLDGSRQHLRRLRPCRPQAEYPQSALHSADHFQNERRLVAVGHSKAAIPLPANTCLSIAWSESSRRIELQLPMATPRTAALLAQAAVCGSDREWPGCERRAANVDVEARFHANLEGRCPLLRHQHKARGGMGSCARLVGSADPGFTATNPGGAAAVIHLALLRDSGPTRVFQRRWPGTLVAQCSHSPSAGSDVTADGKTRPAWSGRTKRPRACREREAELACSRRTPDTCCGAKRTFRAAGNSGGKESWYPLPPDGGPGGTERGRARGKPGPCKASFARLKLTLSR